MYHVLSKSLVMLGPIMPHVCEEAFHYSILKQASPSNDYSLFRSELNFDRDPKWMNNSIKSLFTIIASMRSVFFEIIQSEKMSVFEVRIECSPELYQLLNSMKPSLIDIFGCSNVTYTLMNDSLADSKQVEVNGCIYAFKVTANKTKTSFACNRCRRYTSSKDNQICDRCMQVIDFKKN